MLHLQFPRKGHAAQTQSLAQKPWSTGGGGSAVRPLLWFPGEELVSRVRRLEWASLNHFGRLWGPGLPLTGGAHHGWSMRAPQRRWWALGSGLGSLGMKDKLAASCLLSPGTGRGSPSRVRASEHRK